MGAKRTGMSETERKWRGSGKGEVKRVPKKSKGQSLHGRGGTAEEITAVEYRRYTL